MNVIDEMYYETHEDTLKQEYYDYLDENDMSEDDLSFIEFLDTF